MDKPLSTRVHGVFDYLGGLLLLISPFVLGFSDGPDAAWLVPVVLGVLIIGQSLITRYELSIARILPMRVHLLLDVVIGLALIASPFVLDFFDDGATWVPHVVFGLAILAGALLTQPHPKDHDKHKHVGRRESAAA